MANGKEVENDVDFALIPHMAKAVEGIMNERNTKLVIGLDIYDPQYK